MKYKYYFCNEAVEVDVPEEWAQILQDLDQEEKNNNRRETRHTSSLEEFDPDDWHMASGEDIEATTISLADTERLKKAMFRLPPRQRYLIDQVYFENRSYADIAREEGKSEATIRQSTDRAFNLLKNKLLKR